MKVSEVSAKTGIEIVTESYNDIEVANGYTSDLLSDVMGFAEEESLLITIQAHKNTVAVASQLDLAGIIICNGRKIPDDMKQAAEQNGIAIMRTDENQFVTSYKIHSALRG
ncbi:MAG: DRTGG domain-containing protein [Spirochaetes bacterium]|jgi:serine kinase of HPr protein (carbohydrate metabolism regulator)|nr:DRTGG domain-containing protein [Spirochaetota bacterium]